MLNAWDAMLARSRLSACSAIIKAERHSGSHESVGSRYDEGSAAHAAPSSTPSTRSGRDHPELAEHRTDVPRAVSAPDHVATDLIFERRTRYYVRGVGPSRWLLVVVSYEQTPARIVSAFANRKDPKSWSA